MNCTTSLDQCERTLAGTQIELGAFAAQEKELLASLADARAQLAKSEVRSVLLAEETVAAIRACPTELSSAFADMHDGTRGRESTRPRV